MLQWLDIMHDWPISRQVVWGIRIPVWYEINEASKKDIWVTWIDTARASHQGSVGEFLQKGIHLEEITAGLQKVTVPSGVKQPPYVVSMEKPVGDYLPETDTFDTWFSSGQWPLVTLHEGEYKDRFPTDFMGTLSDILKFWVSRMIMFSLYLKREVPFKDVYLWSMVADAKGTKMSKSKGNVVNPIELIQKYGADAFRAALIFGNSEGGTVNLADDKVIGMRNFTNKIWNIGRFIYLLKNEERKEVSETATNSSTVNALTKEGGLLMKQYLKSTVRQ
jgi:valyl-tRNA synthetase